LNFVIDARPSGGGLADRFEGGRRHPCVNPHTGLAVPTRGFWRYGKGSAMPLLLLIFLLGIACGLRAFTPPAVLWLMRYGGIWGYLLAAAALFEYVGDLQPKAPSRTSAPGLIARILSGAFVGWALALPTGSSIPVAAIVGAAGAVAGAYGGVALRMRAIAAIGAVPAAIAEDAIAILLSVLLVSRL
jgi:uncharacterized membrane protein